MCVRNLKQQNKILEVVPRIDANEKYFSSATSVAMPITKIVKTKS
jgi:hypothetical protein